MRQIVHHRSQSYPGGFLKTVLVSLEAVAQADMHDSFIQSLFSKATSPLLFSSRASVLRKLLVNPIFSMTFGG